MTELKVAMLNATSHQGIQLQSRTARKRDMVSPGTKLL